MYRRIVPFLTFGLIVVGLFGLPHRTTAWSKDAATNTPVSVVSGSVELSDQGVIADGAGGAFIVWADKRSGDFDIYAQHFDRTGAPAWPANGVIVASVTRDQKFARAVSDGTGGLIVVWEDRRDGGSRKDIYLQRLDALGSAKWTANGILVKGDTNESSDPRIVSDNAGGALIFWSEGSDVYGQRADGNGAFVWTSGGIAVAATTGTQNAVRAISDGANGAFVAWSDTRNGTTDLYAQSVTSSGTGQWTTNGVPIVSVTGTQDDPFLVRNPNGGVIAAWREQRNVASLGTDVYIQWLNSAGSPVWASGGLPVVQLAGNQDPAGVIATTDGTYVVTWDDARSGTNRTFAQKFDQSGAMQWASDGIAATTSSAIIQTANAAVADSGGGVFLIFEDSRSGTPDLYAQHLNRAGALQWVAAGIAVSSAVSSQTGGVAISDGSGGLFTSWVDARTDTTGDLYAQQLNVRGQLGVPLRIRLVAGAGPGGGPSVAVFDNAGTKLKSFQAFASTFRGGVNVTTADLDGDGLDEIVTAPVRDGNEIRVFAPDGTRRAISKPFGTKFRGGFSVAAGDLTGDGIADLVVAPRTAGVEPRVMILRFTGSGFVRVRTFLAFPKTMMNGLDLAIGNVRDSVTPEVVASAHGAGPSLVRVLSATGALRSRFTAYSTTYVGGAVASLIDTDGNGTNDIITGPATALTPELRIFSGAGKRLRVIAAYPKKPALGLEVSAGDVNGDGSPEIVVAPSTSAVALVKIFQPTGTLKQHSAAFPTTTKLGVRLALGDVNGDGTPEILTSLNPGASSAVRVFQSDGTQQMEVKPFGGFKGGASIAVGAF